MVRLPGLVAIDAVVDGQPPETSAITLEVRVSFVIDVTDTRIDG